MNHKYYLPIISFLLFPFFIYSQQAIIKGKITDAKTSESMVGVGISASNNSGTQTDLDGNYEIKLSSDEEHTLEMKFIGYKTQTKKLTLKNGETIIWDVQMMEDDALLNEVVVSESKFEKPLSEVTVSMDLVKANLIQNKNTTNLTTVMQQIPGVSVVDGSASIRGGGGYSYGAGSRVMVLIDDVPFLTGDVGEVKWDFVPTENIEQIEVIKGAASALYGSSALNGVISIRTAYPKDVPVTKVTTFGTYYFQPKRPETRWWGDTLHMNNGLSFSHSSKHDNFDLVMGGNFINDNGYKMGVYEKRARFNMSLRNRSKKIEGLSCGINANVQGDEGGNFLYWTNADSGAYITAPGTYSTYTLWKTYINPFVTYYAKNGIRHSFKTMYYHTVHTNTDNQNYNAQLCYAEYQIQKRFKHDLAITTGTANSYDVVVSQLYGSHHATNFALYGQLDKKWNRLNFSTGIRSEYFKVDTIGNVSQFVLMKSSTKDTIALVPVMLRAGFNYRLFQYTFLRTSYGQGYRYPTISERYISTAAGGITIFPNPDLKAETGWSAEFGIKQGLKIGQWKGYVDGAAFITEFNNMMQFTFTSIGGLLGFQSVNTDNARIAGTEFTIAGEGKIGPVLVSILAGYTYMNPIDLNVSADDTTLSENSRILKYRYKHDAKIDVELTYKKFLLGMSSRYNSNMINIDQIFEVFITDAATYREENNKGYIVFDLLGSYKFTEKSTIALICKNLLNKEYTVRPADIQPPRTLTLQYSLQF